MFVNFYEVLEVGPSAPPEVIEQRFRNLARRYHPDNQRTGDRAKFDAIVEAHETLKDAAKRARYHEDHHSRLPPLSEVVEEKVGKPDAAEDDEAADEGVFLDSLGIDRDLAIQHSLLMMLYLKRRRTPQEPGIGNGELERLSGCPHDQLEFHLWYLKSKGWVSRSEDGLLAISIDGVDRTAAIYQEHAKKRITDQS
jgi:curved DNA-binding protein CbpA